MPKNDIWLFLKPWGGSPQNLEILSMDRLERIVRLMKRRMPCRLS